MQQPDRIASSHIIGELGLRLDYDGERFGGQGEVYVEACVPGTDVLRTSVLATWADVLAGIVAGYGVVPRIPLTLDLELQLVAPARVGMVVAVEATAVKVGRTVVVTSAQFHDDATGRLLAVAFASFVPAPDPAAVFSDGFPKTVFDGRLSVPLAQRIGSRVVEPGVVEVPHRADGLNATGAIQGGLLAFSVEEAASSLADEPVLVESLVLRYLRPFLAGPARTVAAGDGPGVSVVQGTDAGTGKLGLVATVRTSALSGRP